MEKEKELIRWEKHYSDGSVEYTDLESTKNFIDNLSSVNGLIASRSYMEMKSVEWLEKQLTTNTEEKGEPTIQSEGERLIKFLEYIRESEKDGETICDNRMFVDGFLNPQLNN